MTELYCHKCEQECKYSEVEYLWRGEPFPKDSTHNICPNCRELDTLQDIS